MELQFTVQGMLRISLLREYATVFLIVVTAAALAVPAVAQSTDDSGGFYPPGPVEVSPVRWDITAYHPGYRRLRSDNVLYLRFLAPIRFSPDASIDQVKGAFLVNWSGERWRFTVDDSWNADRQQFENFSLIDTSLSPVSRAFPIGPLVFRIDLVDGRTIETPVIVHPPGADTASALILYTSGYEGDIGAAHVQALAYAEIRSASIGTDGIGDSTLEIAFTVDDSRVYTGRIYVIDTENEQILKSELFRPWGGGTSPIELNGGDDFHTDGDVNRYIVSGLTEAQRAKADSAYIVLYDGPAIYRYRSFSETVPIDGGGRQ